MTNTTSTIPPLAPDHPYPLIGICGLEGASKSTSIETVRKVFDEAGHPLMTVREPGGTPLAESLRSLLKENTDEVISPLSELLLMSAAREQLYNNVIIPALAKQTVISDRLWACTFAYQIATLPNGDERSRAQRLFLDMNNLITRKAPHSSILFMDVDPEIGLQRARTRGELDRIEQRDIEFFHKAREGYLLLCETYPNLFFRVDANAEMDEVQFRVKGWAMACVSAINYSKTSKVN